MQAETQVAVAAAGNEGSDSEPTPSDDESSDITNITAPPFSQQLAASLDLSSKAQCILFVALYATLSVEGCDMLKAGFEQMYFLTQPTLMVVVVVVMAPAQLTPHYQQ